MSGFIEWLEELNTSDTSVRAVLRRSLAFDPGGFPNAYPIVERSVNKEDSTWRREMRYLVAGLWAAHWRKGRDGRPIPISAACARFDQEKRKTMTPENRNKLSSTERRFVTLLDSDSDELPHRLRQMVALLKEYNIDFEAMLTALFHWNSDRKLTQNQWARDFYRTLNQETEIETTDAKEENE